MTHFLLPIKTKKVKCALGAPDKVKVSQRLLTVRQATLYGALLETY